MASALHQGSGHKTSPTSDRRYHIGELQWRTYKEVWAFIFCVEPSPISHRCIALALSKGAGPFAHIYLRSDELDPMGIQHFISCYFSSSSGLFPIFLIFYRHKSKCIASTFHYRDSQRDKAFTYDLPPTQWVGPDGIMSHFS